MTIFEALIAQIATLSTVAPLVGSRIRPMKFAQKDDISAGPGILLDPNKAEHAVDLSGHNGAKSLKMTFRCVAETLIPAQAVADALEWNGTNPGTGLAGMGPVTVTINAASLVIQKISIDETLYDFIFYDDASDAGYYVVDLVGQVDYTTPA